MAERTCAVCGKRVYPNTGMYFNGMLVHKRCTNMAGAMWFRLKRRK